MPYRRWTQAERAAAVAIARVQGADAAAAESGADARTVRIWMDQAGDAPELAVSPGTWRELMTVAMARTMSRVTSGKMSPVQLATIAGIAARNADRDRAPDVDETTPGSLALDRIEADAAERYGPGNVDLVLALMVRTLDADAPYTVAEPAPLDAAGADYLYRWAVALMDAEPDLDAWRERVDAERAVRWTPPLAPDLAALLAEADALMEMQ